MDKIRQLGIELEKRVAERTAQLQSANEELQAFNYSLSHELRAPLRHVTRSVEQLRNESGWLLSDKSRSHITDAALGLKRMGTIIDAMLTFSRADHSELEKTEVDLNQLVQDALGDFQAETKDRNIAWDIRSLAVVRADRTLLRLVLVNLISNAIKFTCVRDEAKIIIGCETGRDGETVVFISDNGAGFDPRHAAKLFNAFQRLHSTEAFAGTGIGLANVRRIIERHGGRTWAAGELDGGATFYFSLPRHDLKN
jgi:light-regulated signal transduction histidine kinase (bacteriophytochrome)